MLHYMSATALPARRRAGDKPELSEGWKARVIASYRERQGGALSLVEALMRAVGAFTGETASAERIWVNEAERSAGAVVDGVHFRYEHGRLVVLRPCAHCGLGLLASPPVGSAADLGYALAAWQPLHHDCQPEDPADW